MENKPVFKWVRTLDESSIPKPVQSVAGWIFSSDGRLVLRWDEKRKRYGLAGGHVEEYDVSLEATLRRETDEEINCSISNPVLLGWQRTVKPNLGSPQVRFVALLDEVREPRPDIDSPTNTYIRLLVPPHKVPSLIKWGWHGNQQVKDAVTVAYRSYGLEEFRGKEIKEF